MVQLVVRALHNPFLGDDFGYFGTNEHLYNVGVKCSMQYVWGCGSVDVWERKNLLSFWLLWKLAKVSSADDNAHRAHLANEMLFPIPAWVSLTAINASY